jgi:hypothetical protein
LDAFHSLIEIRVLPPIGWLTLVDSPVMCNMTGNDKHATYKNGDLGMVYGIVLPALLVIDWLVSYDYLQL